MAEPASEETARTRFAVISLARLSGVAVTLVGILVTQAVIDLPIAAGYLLIAVGLAETFVVPQLLARKWRTPPASDVE